MLGNIPSKHLKQFRDPKLSLWQSAADIVAKKHYRGPGRPDQGHRLINYTTTVLERAEKRADSVTARSRPGALGELGVRLRRSTLPLYIAFKLVSAFPLRGCFRIAFRFIEAIATAIWRGNHIDTKQYLKELTEQYGGCDLRYIATIWQYIKFRFFSRGEIPYRMPQHSDSFVIDERLPANAKIALVADWGTGLPEARKLLEKLKDKDPDVVIHLGDIYYSGTEPEVKNYFYAIWQDVLGIPAVPWGEELPDADLTARPATFTLSGNHDMYSGGKPYYTLIDMLGQPASCFCLRNDHWQFVALDTGYNDANPTVQSATFLHEEEVKWLKERIRQADGRITVLLSHHQLFTKYEQIASQAINQVLLKQVQEVLPRITVWFWGHEHNLVIYKRFAVTDGVEVFGRCIGHGAIPIGVDEVATSMAPEIPVENVHLAKDHKEPLLQHGYVTMQLRDDKAEVIYYQYDADVDEETILCKETWGKEGLESFQNFS